MLRQAWSSGENRRAGWEQKGNWIIVDGAFYRRDKGGDLTWKAKPVPDDFELRFEWKLSPGCNSGVYDRPGQYEDQVLDHVGSPYGENPRQAAAPPCMASAREDQIMAQVTETPWAGIRRHPSAGRVRRLNTRKWMAVVTTPTA
ncbi:MAG: DUF1080 domain-containing protein [Verrucomicrobia bacterium]|nr:DUF1080 domain-containing protein [Verrucomicrobiota bacterium]